MLDLLMSKMLNNETEVRIVEPSINLDSDFTHPKEQLRTIVHMLLPTLLFWNEKMLYLLEWRGALNATYFGQG